MGLMRLLVHHRDRIPRGGLDHVHICGQDDLPWFARAYFSGNQLIVERNESDSGRIFVPWRIGQSGPLLIGTSTLMERDQPYLLEVELARGMVNCLRNQRAQWEMMGLNVPEALDALITESTVQLARGATRQNEPSEAAEWAEKSLASAAEAMNQLAAEYSQQALALRRAQSRPITSWFGVHLGSQVPKDKVARHVTSAFNMVAIPITWRRIEAVEGRRVWDETDAQVAWAQSAGLRISAGPLLELDDRGVPDWTYLWEGDFNSLLSFMLEHVRAVVERYRGKVHLWQVAARMTHGHALGLNEEARLQLAAKAISVVRQLDSTTPLVVSFDQPWAEYLASEQLDLAPLHFADALVRADLGLSGIGLELNVGYHPGGSIHRGPVAVSRLLDTWSLLELPLQVALTFPSAADADPEADQKIRVLSSEADEVTLESQREWVERHVPLLLAKSVVQVVVWNQLSDAAPHQYPHGGLFDAKDKPKPAFESLKNMRRKYLDAK
jgi:GH35 family endo-1,4-beta-xylanase